MCFEVLFLGFEYWLAVCLGFVEVVAGALVEFDVGFGVARWF